MITGDHAGTATAIGHEMGIDNENGAVTGAQLEEASDEELAELARTHSVFALHQPRAASCGWCALCRTPGGWSR